jgi:uncharacterized protein involved in type VI secretion and phage assembly
MRTRDNGITVGIVDSLDDPEGIGRVRVSYPHLDDAKSEWARLAMPMAGGKRGLFLCPEKNDEVLLAFECGDPRRPYVLGALWSTADAPPPQAGAATDNNWRFLTSRSGHRILLDDTKGAERIEILDKDGKRRVVIDSAAGKIRVECDSGDVEVSASGGKVSVEAATVEIKSSGTMSLEATGALTIKGSTVSING